MNLYRADRQLRCQWTRHQLDLPCRMMMQRGSPDSGDATVSRPDHFGPNISHRPTVNEASARPASMALQKPRPRRSAYASGRKKGSPRGTSTRVSFAICERLFRSCSFDHDAANARMLTSGSVSRNAASRGDRRDNSDTAKMIVAGITTHRITFIMAIHSSKRQDSPKCSEASGRVRRRTSVVR